MGSICERMNTYLSKDLERFVQAKVRSGRFTSSDEAVTEARKRSDASGLGVKEALFNDVLFSLPDLSRSPGEPAAASPPDISCSS